jgi:hypothetical protein
MVVPPGVLHRMARLVQQCYKNGKVNLSCDFRPPTLKSLHENIASVVMVSEIPPPQVRAVAVSEAASSSSAAPAKVEAAPGTPAKAEDYWMETANSWVRVHVVPRKVFYCPTEPDCGPPAAELKDARITSANGRIYNDPSWKAPSRSHRTLSNEWTGSTVFIKVTADLSSSSKEAAKVATKEVAKEAASVGSTVDVPAADLPALPTADGFLGKYLSSLRSELAEAQMQDPKLAEIVQLLKKKSPSEFLAAPRKDLRRVKARSEDMYLTPDGVLATASEEGGDLLVVPDCVYQGKSRFPNAPPRMTWRHLLLAMAHNGSAHRRAEEMAVDLSSSFNWNPCEHLRRDCETWTGRCKACVAVHRRPRAQPALLPVRDATPFRRMQIDLCEINPVGEGGERYVATIVCVSTRCVFFRTLTTRDSSAIAAVMLDVTLDCGVTPQVWQSD